jgi:hypothetical protein
MFTNVEAIESQIWKARRFSPLQTKCEEIAIIEVLDSHGRIKTRRFSPLRRGETRQISPTALTIVVIHPGQMALNGEIWRAMSDDLA